MKLRVLLACLRVQTHEDWQAVVLDQGAPEVASEIIRELGDARVGWYPVQRREDWGQAEKFAAAERATSEWVGFPQDDAYYCPRYFELMLAAAHDYQTHGARLTDLVYCDWVSDRNLGRPYAPFTVAPRVGHIDVGGFLVRRETLIAHGWPDKGPTGDGLLIESLVKSGVRHVRVPACLYTKN